MLFMFGAAVSRQIRGSDIFIYHEFCFAAAVFVAKQILETKGKRWTTSTYVNTSWYSTSKIQHG